MTSRKKLVERLFSSDVKVELLELFHRNPGLLDTVDGVARRIGRTGDNIQTDVQDFVQLGLLKWKQIGTSEILVLDRETDSKIQEEVSEHLMREAGGTGK